MATTPSRPFSTEVIGADWTTSSLPAHADFRAWTERHRAASPDIRAELEAEGVALALARRQSLHRLIVEDPRTALSLAVPDDVRRELPSSVAALLETRVSKIGPLGVMVALPPGNGGLKPAGESLVSRATRLDHREYRAHVYGRRAFQATQEKTSIVGIAIERELAVSDAVYRTLTPAEAGKLGGVVEISPTETPHASSSADNAPAFVEFDGTVHRVCCAAHLAALEADLLALETLPLGINEPILGVPEYPRPPDAWTHGFKKLLVIRVDFSDLPGAPKYGTEPIDDDDISEAVNGPQGIRDFFLSNSAGQSTVVLTPPVAGVSPDITPTLRMTTTAATFATTGGYYTLRDEAIAAAKAAGYATDAYDRITLLYSNVARLPGSVVLERGRAELVGRICWANGEFNFPMITHELGHNYGLPHASLWLAEDGNPVSLDGRTIEYGDPHDIMGGAYGFDTHINHRYKNFLRWMPDTAVVTASVDGVYRIHRHDGAAPNLDLPRAVKFARAFGRDYWLGYRRATNLASLDNGVSVLLSAPAWPQTLVVNLNPPYGNPTEPGLPLFTTFVDEAAGIAMMPTAQGGAGDDEWIDVEVDFAPFKSRVKWTRTQWYFDEQGARAELTLARFASASGAASVRYTTSAGTAAAPSNFSAQTGMVAWSDGDTAEKKITIFLTPDSLAEGIENFTVTLSAPGGAIISGGPVAVVNIADAGRRDPTFNFFYSMMRAQCVLPLPDGRVLIGGQFANAPTGGSADINRRGLIAVSASGASLATFGGGPGSFATTGAFGTLGSVNALARQPDGRLLVAGDFISFNGTSRPRILRFTADGALDATFDPGAGADATIHALFLQADGKIVIGGEFTTYRGIARRHLARLNPDGSLDETFLGPAFASEPETRVKVVAGLSGGKLLVGGRFSFSSGPARSGLCRVHSNGALDASFVSVGEGAHALSEATNRKTVHALAVQSDGRVLVAGDFSAFHGQPRGGLARLEADGALDAGFTPTSDGSCYSLSVLGDARILVGGAFTRFNGEARTNLVRLTGNGALDPAFASNYAGSIHALALWSDDRLLFAGDRAAFQEISIPRATWSVFSAAQRTAAITTQPRSRTVRAGAAVTLSATADGAGPLTYQWFHDGVALAGATEATLTFAAVRAADSGAYSVSVTNPFGTTTSSVATLDVRPQALRLTGIATRARVGTGSDIQIGGFAISGTVPKRVVIRATGPTLADYGVAGALVDPVLSLYSGTTLLAQNDDWNASDAAEFTRLGMAAWPVGSRDAAFILTLAPGSYTAQVAGKAGGTGIALIEIYDADDPTSLGQLTGISTRALVGNDSRLLVGGFAITSDAPKRVLVRASGPALTQYGLTGALADPVLTIFSGQTVIASNDDWDASLAADFEATGMFKWETGSKDAALFLSLPSGAYTAQVSGKDGATGVALIEIYEE